MAKLILAIDDDTSILEFYRSCFEMEGYRVHLSSELLTTQQVKAIHPDLVLLDVKLYGKLSGPGFRRLLKDHPQTAHIPVVLCSAVPSLEEQNEPFIQKPFS